ncbi:diguanylate cyclase [Janthinobacterium sp. GW460P]|uniref:diguanylate cyclase n=1 Tax=unclassified Janthinobacterium TaxID=2610881 RepID=UPI000A322FC6|nr:MULTISPECIES: diguanylate cyclase [unclassified Janthinobacterium]MCC7700921.1 diguanylate cyclase [Janthinobacterium sp. GW460P]MCC7706428.1 diguanylate cyclase [Janthinobacterium sp. GW460W]
MHEHDRTRWRDAARRLWPGLLLWLCCAVPLPGHAQTAAPSDAPHPAPRQVLVLYSLGSDASSLWQTLIHRGMSAELGNQNLSVTPGLFEERLDSVRVGELPAVAGLEAYLQTKYRMVQLDAIITENYLAAQFLRQHPKLFPGVPRYYVNQGRQDWIPADGINLDVRHDFGKAIAIMLQVLPGLRQIAIVGDGSARGQAWIADLRSATRPYQGRLQIDFWDHLSQEELRRRTGELGSGSAIYLLPVYRDVLGERTTPPAVARDLAARSAVPIFTSVESMIVPGVTGGYVISGEEVGRTIARILQGKTPAADGMQAYIFDDAAVRRFGLRNLPDEARILNRPQGVWAQYHWQIIAGLSLIALQAALITALLLAQRSRRASVAALHAERDVLEERVLQRTLELLVANSRLEQQATTDPLTGLGNRRMMTLRLGEELERAQRFGHTLSLLMIDIDYFKRINDGHGHNAGDRAIVAMAQVLRGVTRAMDTAARFGGEEFVLLMPETPLPVALEVAERLRMAAACLRVECDDGQQINLTISIGVTASVPQPAAPNRRDADSLTDLLIRADQALYRAKHGGRDRVESA